MHAKWDASTLVVTMTRDASDAHATFVYSLDAAGHLVLVVTLPSPSGGDPVIHDRILQEELIEMHRCLDLAVLSAATQFLLVALMVRRAPVAGHAQDLPWMHTKPNAGAANGAAARAP